MRGESDITYISMASKASLGLLSTQSPAILCFAVNTSYQRCRQMSNPTTSPICATHHLLAHI